ncbi:MAG TPA: alpha/beta fold hydrolase [Solirubrobacteraceae bacterium]
MSQRVTGIGVELCFEERGQGAPLLLIHGLAQDHVALLPLAETLAGAGAGRVIAYSRRGYSPSGAPEPYDGTTVAEQAEDAASLLAGLDARGALAVGEGFGALIVLDLLLRHPRLLRGAVLVDPPLFAFVPEATRALADERGRIQEAVFAGGPRAGVAAWLDGQAGAPRQGSDRERALQHHHAFFADYAGLATLPVTRRELRAIDAPVAIVTGPSTEPHVLAAAEALAGLIQDVRRARDGDVVSAVTGLA